MKKYILVFICGFLFIAITLCMESHFCTQKNSMPPLSWEEVWEERWAILFFSIIAGIWSVLNFYGEFDKKD